MCICMVCMNVHVGQCVGEALELMCAKHNHELQIIERALGPLTPLV